jgi:GNAT superfamily N-acetyltransferase
MHVRDASEQDADTACAVIRRSIGELCALDHKGDAATLAAWLANKTPDNVRSWIGTSHLLVAVDAGAILGVAAMSASGEVLLNYVSPDVRFRGVSKALIEGLEARAASLGLTRLTLKSTATAVRFYRAAGFSESGPPTKGFGLTMAQPMQKGLRPIDERKGDTEAIEALVARQLASLSWSRGGTPDGAAFAADFLDSAVLFPAARPARAQSVPDFVERMNNLAQSSLRSFREVILGTKVHVFGNVAVAIAAAEMVENDAETSRNVEMMLLVKSEGAWRIVAQAWDRASDTNPIPEAWLHQQA